MIHKQALGFGGDSHPGEEPQAISDRQMNNFQNHDEPNYEPQSASYNFFYGGGQLHVSPDHDHSNLREHAGVDENSIGPMAVGEVSVDADRATWHVEGNVAMRGLFKVLKEYTESVGWRWGGLTDIEGEPIDDDFAPKKSMHLVDNETGGRIHFALQGKTAYVGKMDDDKIEAIRSAGYKIAEYPGGGDMNQKIKRREDLQEKNIYDPNPTQNTTLKDESQPTGTFKCPNCSDIYSNWQDYMSHRQDEDGMLTELPKEDGKFPELPDMDKALPNNYHEQFPFYATAIRPLSSWKEASRVEGFDLYAGLWGYDNDDHKHYGAFLNGEPIAYATMREDGPRKATLVIIYSAVHGVGAGKHLMAGLKTYYDEITTGVVSISGGKLVRSSGMIEVDKGIYKWSAGQDSKDMIDNPVPFIYDINKDTLVAGHPGQRTSDIPGEFTPGGIVEGTYEPGGKVILQTMTNMPYTTRHLLDLWYWSFPHMEVTSVELKDANGQQTKIAKISSTDVGSYIKTLAATDPAVWNSFKALKQAGGEVYVVGGAVRDALMQKTPKDIDLMVTGVPSDKVNHILSQLPGRVDLTGKSFGVYRYRVKGHEVEIALPRTEQSTGDRRVDFNVNVDHNLPVEDDLLRRDFTVNAMAVDLSTGALVDPYHGSDDIEHRRLKTTHPSSFKEDPTRLLRALVMNGRYGMTPDEETRQQIALHKDRLPLESADARQPIMDKIMTSHDPARAMRLAHETGLLKHILPEVSNNFDFDQNNPHHKFKLGEHLLNVLENVSTQSGDPDLRMAALLHDIGKPASAWKNPETGFNHYYQGADGQGQNHEEVGADMAEERLRALRYPVARIKRIRHLIQNHMFSAFSREKGARKFLHKVGDENADDLLTFRWADQHGKGQTPAALAARTSVDTQRGLVEQVRSKQQPTSQSALAINGSDIIALGVPAGPLVGKILRLLTDEVVQEPMLNDHDKLLELAKEYSKAG
jgi:tRNA nucleotidyltransferase (CCA-adding enzyme)